MAPFFRPMACAPATPLSVSRLAIPWGCIAGREWLPPRVCSPWALQVSTPPSTRGRGASGSPIRTGRSRSADDRPDYEVRPALPRTPASEECAPVPRPRERVARRWRVKRRVLRDGGGCKAIGHAISAGGTLANIAEDSRVTGVLPDRWLNELRRTSRDLRLIRGDGAYVWDDEQRQYLDLTSSGGTTLLGYNHPRVSEAIANQVMAFSGVPPRFDYDLREELLEALSFIIPVPLTHVSFTTSGSAAVDLAITMVASVSQRPLP